MNIKNTVLFLTLIISISYQTSAQEGLDKVFIKSYMIQSKALEQDREIQVYLPDSYQGSSQKYAVLYVLDGQQYFFNAIGYQQIFRHYSKTPEFIVVGIDTRRTQRQALIDLKAKKLLTFIEQDVIAFVDRKFRTSKDRMLFGWERSGGFVVQVLAERPNLFNGYFAASPDALNWRRNPKFEMRIDALDKLLSKKVELNTFLYFAVSKNEPWLQKGLDSLVGLLEEKAPKGLKWKFVKLDGETHQTTPHQTIYKALEEYYRDYSPIKFNSLKEFNEAGGIKNVYNHYKKRGEKYGISTEIGNRTKSGLIIKAFQEDNYLQFDSFLTEFKGYILQARFSANWGMRFGQFYLKNKNPDKAIALFNKLIIKFPDFPAVINNGLGDAYRDKGDFQKAVSFYRNAIRLAKANSEPGLAEFQSNLDALQTKNKNQ